MICQRPSLTWLSNPPVYHSLVVSMPRTVLHVKLLPGGTPDSVPASGGAPESPASPPPASEPPPLLPPPPLLEDPPPLPPPDDDAPLLPLDDPAPQRRRVLEQ